MANPPEKSRFASKIDADRRADTFIKCKRKFELAAEQAQAILWAVQLEEFPDSVRIPHNMVHQWAYDEPNRAEWERVYANENAILNRGQIFDAWQKYITDHQLRAARGITISVQDLVGVFYVCGKREDGSYRYRGYRYGVEGSQYQSGFGT